MPVFSTVAPELHDEMSIGAAAHEEGGHFVSSIPTGDNEHVAWDPYACGASDDGGNDNRLSRWVPSPSQTRSLPRLRPCPSGPGGD